MDSSLPLHPQPGAYPGYSSRGEGELFSLWIFKTKIALLSRDPNSDNMKPNCSGRAMALGKPVQLLREVDTVLTLPSVTLEFPLLPDRRRTCRSRRLQMEIGWRDLLDLFGNFESTSIGTDTMRELALETWKAFRQAPHSPMKAPPSSKWYLMPRATIQNP